MGVRYGGTVRGYGTGGTELGYGTGVRRTGTSYPPYLFSGNVVLFPKRYGGTSYRYSVRTEPYPRTVPTVPYPRAVPPIPYPRTLPPYRTPIRYSRTVPRYRTPLRTVPVPGYVPTVRTHRTSPYRRPSRTQFLGPRPPNRA